MRSAILNAILVPMVLTTFWLIQLVQAGYSCKEAKLCCSGRDSACVVQKTSPYAIIEGPQDKPCYCDHACLKLGDCCNDFKETCGVVDCTVSTWGSWSTCDRKCGPGTQTRSRTILNSDKHGGKHCPQLEESRICHSSDDCQRRNYSIPQKEIALLVPKNLDGSEDSDDGNTISNGYCVSFKVIKATKACRKDPTLATLSEGVEVCVRCQTRALRRVLNWRCQGDGEQLGGNRWSVLSSAHCHGRWIRTLKTGPECEGLACRSEAIFLFV
ncbi:somatomedin-B and thrombospondin type-1 domain-containing protein-like isoform X1 [Neodiprion virginianus]|uniref:somatomedin-B and thrombospondin type-1 domain-containing protein-like isoform X1 n=1 Tax=Neodiprion virginianus TaxID=2961670 RepID=UPI001EE77EA3|nr:somatomedin-B and thrombospondin type-1 domain-containing protein-like isoform X1 [Neodiprion virginianus]XP_046607729.1 somatomedin-B and thrombospondin type-1 domain-containing protein-like isoform X2 [Neodiprion virginianus]XP_046607730.1 somatomedin-B and thrombospondin type-1 domain-containing protein-like isoform X1 [Neodiprion virginianus]